VLCVEIILKGSIGEIEDEEEESEGFAYMPGICELASEFTSLEGEGGEFSSLERMGMEGLVNVEMEVGWDIVLRRV